MRILLITFIFVSIAFSQDKMILKSGKQLVSGIINNYKKYDTKSNLIDFDSEQYLKSQIALLILHNGKVFFRSGMTITEYNALSIRNKAVADKKFSSKDFSNHNYELLRSFNAFERQAYLQHFNNTKYSSQEINISARDVANGALAGVCLFVLALSYYMMHGSLGYG